MAVLIQLLTMGDALTLVLVGRFLDYFLALITSFHLILAVSKTIGERMPCALIWGWGWGMWGASRYECVCVGGGEGGLYLRYTEGVLSAAW